MRGAVSFRRVLGCTVRNVDPLILNNESHSLYEAEKTLPVLPISDQFLTTNRVVGKNVLDAVRVSLPERIGVNETLSEKIFADLEEPEVRLDFRPFVRRGRS